MTGDAWAQALADFRQRKDEHFGAGRGPIQGEALASFTGLSYFPPAPDWVFELPLHPATEQAEFALQTNSGETRFMSLLGTVSVPLPGGNGHALQVFAPLGEDAPRSVLLPFRDATSGPQTYGAGRYIDAPLVTGPAGQTVHLDFNRAYHPYCAYSDGWTCPLPPPQNHLPLGVEAGETLP